MAGMVQVEREDAMSTWGRLLESSDIEDWRIEAALALRAQGVDVLCGRDSEWYVKDGAG